MNADETLMSIAGQSIGKAMNDYLTRQVMEGPTEAEARQMEIRHKAEERFVRAMHRWFFGQKKEVQQALSGRYLEQQWPDLCE